ncbi:MAG: CDP-alcohol phosphatidyltransferase family protein [Clostridiales bacterium]|nr:CDP-alcohol phosphatidyltransferase family protein [Clostridiales bacterium]
MNLPNKISFIRIALIPVFVVLLFVPFPWHMLAATAVFAVACFTDMLDGYIARSRHLVTELGAFLDTTADKMLVACALIAISALIPPVAERFVSPVEPYTIAIVAVSMIIVSRELMISGFKAMSAKKGAMLTADMFGKVKAVVQMAALIIILPVEDFYYISELAGQIIFYVGFGLFMAAGLLTIASAINYLVRNRSVLDFDEKEKASGTASGSEQAESGSREDVG